MKKIIILTVLAFVLSGCGIGDRYELSESSENWEVNYIIELSKDNNQLGTGTIEYIGEEPVPETFNYEIRTKNRGLEVTDEQLTNRKIKFGMASCESCSFDEDDEIDVEIVWYGQKDNFTLTMDN